MKAKQIMGGVVAAALVGAFSPAFAQTGTSPAVRPTPTATPLPSSKPKCVNAPINNVPRDCAPDVSIGATGSAAASSSSADIAKQNSDANASVGIGAPGSAPLNPTQPSGSSLAKPAAPVPPAVKPK